MLTLYRCNVNTRGCGPILTPTGVKFNTPVFAVYDCEKYIFVHVDAKNIQVKSQFLCDYNIY